ncbi:MAG: hypothetical protein HY368_00520 [Candidatus Aenigmarchaeota archaeon]|nr:hypothetical protein [Candidatus Aenigmarchaeota archaeon]
MRRNLTAFPSLLKGQQQAISAILLSGILIGIVGSIYMWGIPLIQKNKDISLLQSSEQFMLALDNKVKSVTNTGGRDQLRITVPGLVSTSSTPGGVVVQLDVDTQGTIYATGAEIPLKNATCSAAEGSWGSDESGILCVKSVKLDENKYRTTYTLRYVPLRTQTIRTYSIILGADEAESAGMDHAIVIENKGTSEADEAGRIVTKTSVKVDLI